MRVVTDPLQPIRGFRIRRDESPKSVPAREDDFCHCERGRESLRWWKGGCAAPSDLLALGFDACVRCDPDTGLYRYQGLECIRTEKDIEDAKTTYGRNVVGVIIMHASWSPPLFVRTWVLEPEIRQALEESVELRRMREARAEMVKNATPR